MFDIYGASCNEQVVSSIKLHEFILFIICYRISFLFGQLIIYLMLKLVF
jgi:hypothetical protein